MSDESEACEESMPEPHTFTVYVMPDGQYSFGISKGTPAEMAPTVLRRAANSIEAALLRA